MSIALAVLVSELAMMSAPVEMNGIVVTAHSIAPVRTIGGHKSKVVFSVMNNTAHFRSVEVECSLYFDGTPTGSAKAKVREVPPGSQVVGEALGHAESTLASCRPVEISDPALER